MAESLRLSKDALSQIADGLATLSPIVFGPDAVAIEIAETFPICEIDERVTNPQASLRDLAPLENRYHHQILVNGEPVGVAHSQFLTDRKRWRVVRLARSKLATYIDQALDVIDAEAPERVPVWLLKASPYRVSALWLAGGDRERLYIVSRPPFRREIPLKEFVSPEEFVRALERERSFVQRGRPQQQAADPVHAPEDDEPVDL